VSSEKLERTLRTSRVTGIYIDPLLTAVLLGELLNPSQEIWLVSAWISDVIAIDNTRGDYDSLFAEASAREYSLSEILGALTVSKSRLHVVTRNADSNTAFLTRLGRTANADRLEIVPYPDVHEKTLCGDDWLLSGSMNFTFRGMQINDEAMTYRLGSTAAAAARVDFKHRWKKPS
jgi:phosphatidylserine/phosphatidylglycerophosphate/cardiolipin synthase-like enzyme